MTKPGYLWRVWTEGTSTTASNTLIWSEWSTTTSASTISFTTTSTGSNTLVWPVWNVMDEEKRQAVRRIADAAAARVAVRPVHSAEQLAAWRAEEARREAEREEAKRTILAAALRAEELLQAHLSPEQREDLARIGGFYLDSVGQDGARKRYRIDRGTHGNVKLLSPDGQKIVGQYCVQPNQVPAADAMLAQKLHLEANEEAFVRAANFTRY